MARRTHFTPPSADEMIVRDVETGQMWLWRSRFGDAAPMSDGVPFIRARSKDMARVIQDDLRNRPPQAPDGRYLHGARFVVLTADPKVKQEELTSLAGELLLVDRENRANRWIVRLQGGRFADARPADNPRGLRSRSLAEELANELDGHYVTLTDDAIVHAGGTVVADLVRRRRALGLSQNQLARALGVNQSTITRWEAGDRTVENPEMLDLALEALEARRTPPPQPEHTETGG